MINELREIIKEWGIGAGALLVGGINWVASTRKLDKTTFYDYKNATAISIQIYKDETAARLAAGNIKFAEIEGNQKCLPVIQADLKEVLQKLAGLEATIKAISRE